MNQMRLNRLAAEIMAEVHAITKPKATGGFENWKCKGCGQSNGWRLIECKMCGSKYGAYDKE